MELTLASVAKAIGKFTFVDIASAALPSQAISIRIIVTELRRDFPLPSARINSATALAAGVFAVRL